MSQENPGCEDEGSKVFQGPLTTLMGSGPKHQHTSLDLMIIGLLNDARSASSSAAQTWERGANHPLQGGSSPSSLD